MDEQAAKVLVAAFGDAHQDRLVAAGELPRDKPDPGGEMAAVLELGPVADGRDDGSCCLRTDPFDSRKALASLALAEGEVLGLLEIGAEVHPLRC